MKKQGKTNQMTQILLEKSLSVSMMVALSLSKTSQPEMSFKF